MKIKKTVLALALAMAVMFGLMIGVNAADTLETISAYLNYGITVKYNGEAQELIDADGNKVYPITYNGTTYLPVRAISNILGVEVNWDGKTKTVLLEGSRTALKTPADTSEANFTINQNVRLAGETDWHDNVYANVGDRVEFQVVYNNISENQLQSDVGIKAILPKNLCYIEGSTRLYNSVFPSGSSVNEDSLPENGINIGNYNSGANAFVRFTAEVVDNSLESGSNTLVNWMQGGVGQKTIQDYATVMVNKAK